MDLESRIVSPDPAVCDLIGRVDRIVNAIKEDAGIFHVVREVRISTLAPMNCSREWICERSRTSMKITDCFAAPVRPQGSIVPDVRDAAFRQQECTNLSFLIMNSSINSDANSL